MVRTSGFVSLLAAARPVFAPRGRSGGISRPHCATRDRPRRELRTLPSASPARRAHKPTRGACQCSPKLSRHFVRDVGKHDSPTTRTARIRVGSPPPFGNCASDACTIERPAARAWFARVVVVALPRGAARVSALPEGRFAASATCTASQPPNCLDGVETV